MGIFLFILAVVVFIVVRGIIVGGKRMNGYYEVLNSKGNPVHFGSWSECMQHAKAQRDYCRTFGIKETFTVKEKKF